ncbi:MAG TPA: GrpB family protein [Micromonosporaceae bacterium]
MIAGSSPLRAVVVQADPGWAEQGQALAEALGTTLGPLAVRVEHIGSTAIAGMAAKAVFDLQVSVEDLDDAAEAFTEPLARLGFTRMPYHQDHVPAGRADDPARWVKRFWVRRGKPAADVHLHVRRIGNPNERAALLFRDWFRAHPDAIAAYARFKSMLAEAVPDAASYAEVKDPVVDLILVVAERWAQDTGWRVWRGPQPAAECPGHEPPAPDRERSAPVRE